MDTNIFTRDDTKKRELETAFQEPENSDLSKTAIQFYDFASVSKENCSKNMLSNGWQFSKNIYNLSE